MANISMAPGVLIQELTGPGVIAGVGTSTAAFIGPAVAGPMNVPRFITSYDEFLAIYAVPVDGGLNPHIPGARKFYLAHAVEGFFLNGGHQAYIVRVGTGKSTEWEVKNNAAQPVFRLRAKKDGEAGNSLKIEIGRSHRTGDAGVEAASGSSKVTNVDATDKKLVTVEDPTVFRVGDLVDKGESSRASVELIDGATLTLSNEITALAVNDPLSLSNLFSSRATVRLKNTSGISPGSVVLLKGDDADTPAADEITEHAVVQNVDNAGFVTFALNPARAKNFKIAGLKLISEEFSLVVTRQQGNAETFGNLSLESLHPNHVRSAVLSDLVDVLPPLAPPAANTYPAALVDTDPNPNTVAPKTNGANDNPLDLTADQYKEGIDALNNVDDVNILVVPDASSHGGWEAIQAAMINHCIKLKDRFTILDSRPNATRDEVLEHRKKVESENGRAALYYPWLEVRDPVSPRVPLPLFIPPSGHLAGIYARTDQDRGVHKAPANTDVRGVFGLQARVNDDQQIKLNDEGINVLRIFQGSDSVIVWGARTTVRKDVTDWRYVPVRRLLLFIEESIEEGIRFAVFEPNGLPLWQQLKRTIREFLTRVWRDGALFGDTADKAFQVRIDEALNPPSVRALGQLFIEIKVAPVRPAEFIIVRIGLFDGGAEVTES